MQRVRLHSNILNVIQPRLLEASTGYKETILETVSMSIIFVLSKIYYIANIIEKGTPIVDEQDKNTSKSPYRPNHWDRHLGKIHGQNPPT